jgi:hypothetical protein
VVLPSAPDGRSWSAAVCEGRWTECGVAGRGRLGRTDGVSARHALNQRADPNHRPGCFVAILCTTGLARAPRLLSAVCRGEASTW